ncbi:MAG: nucleoside/nucleotide kinase family protein [Vulcanimicrobiaceae bacterium]
MTAQVQATTREELLRRLGDAIITVPRTHPLRVAIDGVDGAGKTTLADELVPYIERHGRPVIRASTDGFHQPRAARYRRGVDSPEGFYYDSFDYDAVRTTLLDPLGPGGHRRYRTATFDWRVDVAVDAPVREATENEILLFDGVFAQRRELADAWDLCIFLKVGFDETLRRLMIRDIRPGTSPEELQRRFWARYAAGQRLYLASVRPSERAHILVDNRDPARPRILREQERTSSLTSPK